MTKSNWRDELYLDEVAGTVGKTVTRKIVRQGIKVGGKRGGRAAQGAVAAGKTATQHAMQKKEAGRGEKIGKVVGGVAGGITGGALGAPLGGVGAIGTGIAGGEVGERVGGAIGKKFDKKKVGITTAVKEETLLYDVVHDYIITENFASDTEGANKVMLKLSDELMQEIYERTMTASEKRKDTMLKKKYDDSDMKKNMQAQYGKEEGKKVYFATIRKQAMKEEVIPEAKVDTGKSDAAKQNERNQRTFGNRRNSKGGMAHTDDTEARRYNTEKGRGVKMRGKKDKTPVNYHKKDSDKRVDALLKSMKEAVYKGPDKEDRKVINKMYDKKGNKTDFAKKAAEYEKNMNPKKRQALKDKATKGMKFTHEEVVSEEDKKGKGSGKKDACYHKVKASASVWPSAYASGRLVQCRKKGAANYGNSKKESYSWRDDFDYVEEGAAWTKKAGKNPEGGLNEKGRKSYERENPGSNLKAPQPEGGSRKKSFCARMGGMKKKLTSSKTANDPNSRINKALRKWKC